MEDNNYYKIPISFFWAWFSIIVMGLLVLISGGILFILLIVPLLMYLCLKNTQYLYNEKEFIIKSGIIFKSVTTISMQKIEEINVTFLGITLVVQGKPTVLMYIKKARKELDKLQQVWREVKERTNERNEVKTSNNSNADEIIKFKQLLDSGVITQEEFDKKKQELLR